MFPFLMNWEEEERFPCGNWHSTPLKRSRQWSQTVHFWEVSFDYILLKRGSSAGQLCSVTERHIWLHVFGRFHPSPRSLLPLRLHISQCSAFGITPLKSLSALPTAAMTTAAELCASESRSVIVCLIANHGVCVRVCTAQTREQLCLCL